MFDNIINKAGKLNKARKVASDMKKVQKELENVFATSEKHGIRVVVRGDRKIEKIEIDNEESKELKEVINNAMKEIDKKVEKQMRGRMDELGLGDIF